VTRASESPAAVAGVLLAFTVPVRRRDGAPGRGLAEHLEHLIRPVSAGIAVPVFAFFAAGVHIGGVHGFTEALTDPVAVGVIAGLLVGKCIGIAGSTWVLATFTRAELDDELAWVDVIGMALLGGIGFTVSLLIGELAFGAVGTTTEHVKVGVLVGSLLAGGVATLVLRSRNRVYRRLCAIEEVDSDADGVPDAFEPGDR
jgi:NhaA family Na+:H+ antiporter